MRAATISKSGFLKTAVDLSDQVLLYAIRFDDGERLLNGHVLILLFDIEVILNPGGRAGHTM